MLTGQRADVRQVHLHRVSHPGAEREGDRRRDRRHEGVEARLPEQVEVALDQRPGLLGLEIERVVVAGRQRVRAEHDPDA